MTPEDAHYIGQIVRMVVQRSSTTNMKTLWYMLLSEKALFPYDVDAIHECLQTIVLP